MFGVFYVGSPVMTGEAMIETKTGSSGEVSLPDVVRVVPVTKQNLDLVEMGRASFFEIFHSTWSLVYLRNFMKL